VPIPSWVTRVNRAATNRLMLRLSSRLPPLATVQHVGRRSGRTYRTPIMAFRTPRGVVVALTYGADVDWLRNVLAAGSFVLVRRGWAYRVSDLRRTAGDDGPALVPAWTRRALMLLRVDQFLQGAVHPLGRADQRSDA
jgi:deazaflavin-dependent oxidoreductase (nitroreductase family)